jgi:DNA-binding NarL/FixJ family response regulator
MRVIIVDDNDIFRSTLKNIVEQDDRFTVVAEASCGEKAIETIRDTEADLVLLDLSLPKIDGITVLEEVRKFSSIKILVLTIFSEAGVTQNVLETGADGICSKDYGRDVLVEAMIKTMQGERPVLTL